MNLLLAASLWAVAPSARAADPRVLVVLSAERPVFLEASEAFRRSFPGETARLLLGDGAPAVPASIDVVVAFGSRAARLSYPAGVTLILALAPGSDAADRHPGPVSAVVLEPEPGQLLARLKTLARPGRRLGLLWSSGVYAPYVRELSDLAREEGLLVSASRLHSRESLPERLRLLAGHIDTLWVPADPLLLDERSLNLLGVFSREKGVDLVISAPGLSALGHRVLSGSYDAVGRSAARAAQDALDGRSSEVYYPDELVAETSPSDGTRREGR